MSSDPVVASGSLRLRLKREKPKEEKQALSRNERSKMYRDTLKLDPKRYQDFQKVNARRSKEHRRTMSADARKNYNEKTKLRMKAYRDRKKGNDVSQPTKCHTRKETSKMRENWRKWKVSQRQKMSPEVKQRNLQRRRDRYREKKMNSLELLNQQAARATQTSIRRATLPQDGDGFARRLEEIVDTATPTKKQKIKDTGLLNTPQTRQRNTINYHIAYSVKRRIRFLQQDKSGKSELRALTKIVNTGRHAAEHVVRKELSIKWEYWRRHSFVPEEAYIPAKGDLLRREVREKVTNFYVKEATPLPGKRSVSRKTNMQKYILVKSIRSVWKDFNEKSPKVSLSFFQKLRPKEVTTVDHHKFNGCLCEYCTNVELKLKVLNRKGDVKLQDRYEAVRQSMCSKSDDDAFHKLACIKRQCSDCGVSVLKKKYDVMLAASKDDTDVCWDQWENGVVKVNGKSTTKKILKNKTGSLATLTEQILQEIEKLSEHLFIAKWQFSQFNDVRGAVPPNWVVSIADFAENYRCSYQDEISAAYYQYQQATVHPLIAYYNCPTCDGTVEQSAVFITPDLKHDAHAVNQFSKRLMGHISSNGSTIEHVVQYSDNCASQYKSKIPFLHVSRSVNENGYTYERSYFGSRHGKGPCDALGGVIKSCAERFVKSRQGVIRDAEELYRYCDQKLATSDTCTGTNRQHKSRVFFYEPVIHRKKPPKQLKTVVGTRQLHNIHTVDDGIVEGRGLSCYCSACVSRKSGCINVDYVDSFHSYTFCSGLAKGKHSGGSKTGINAETKPKTLRKAEHTEHTHQNSMESEPAPVSTEDKISKSTKRKMLSKDDTEVQEHSLAKKCKKQQNSAKTETTPHALVYTRLRGSRIVQDGVRMEMTKVETLKENKVQRGRKKGNNSREIAKPVNKKTGSMIEQDDVDMEKMAKGEHAEDSDFFTTLSKQLNLCQKYADVEDIVHNTEELPPLPKQDTITFVTHKLSIDKVAVPLVPNDLSVSGLYQSTIYGDGNCLPRCVSVLCYGDEDHFKETRARIVIELVRNKEKYLQDKFFKKGGNLNKNIIKRFAMFSEYYNAQVLSQMAIRQIFEDEVLAVAHNGTFMGVWQVASVANILERPVVSVYPPYAGATVRGDLDRTFHPFHEKCPNGIPPTAYIMWSNTQGVEIEPREWRPNHFVVLLKCTEVTEEVSVVESTAEADVSIRSLDLLYDTDELIDTSLLDELISGLEEASRDHGHTDDTTETEQGHTDDTTETEQGHTDDTAETDHGPTDDTTATEQGHTDDTAETDQGHTDDTTETEQSHTDDTTATEQGHTDDTTATDHGHTDDTKGNEQGHTDDTTETEQGYTDDTAETDQGHTDDTTETEQGHTDDTTATDHGHTDDTTETEQSHTDDTTATELGHTDDTTETDDGHTDDTTEMEQGHTDDTTETDHGHTDDTTETEQSHTDDTTATEQGHTDDTTATDHGHTDDTKGNEQGHTDDTTETEQGHTDDTAETDQGHTDDTTETEQGHTDDTTATDHGHTDDTTDTEQSHTDDTTATELGHTDDTTETDDGHTDDTTEMEQGHTDDTTETDHGHTDDTTETEQSHTDDTTATEQGHTDDTAATEQGHTDDTTATDHGHTDDTKGNEQGHTDDTTKTEQGHTDDTAETDQGHTDDTTETEQGHTDDTTATDHGHTDDTTETEQSHTDDTTATELGHTDDTTETDDGHTDDTTEMEQGHTDDTTETDHGHTDDTTETEQSHTDHTTATEQGHTDDTAATEQGHTDDTTATDHGHTDDTKGNEQGHTDDTTKTEQGHTDDTAETDQGHTDDTTETEQGHTDDTTATDHGHTDDTTETEQSHTDDTTATELGHTDDTTETDDGHTDDTTEMEQGHTDDTTETDHGHTDDTTETEQSHTDHTTATEQGHTDDTAATEQGHTDDTTATDQGHTDDTTATDHGHIDDTTETEQGHTDDTAETEQGHTDDNTETDHGHTDDTTETEQGHTDDNAETEQCHTDDNTETDHGHTDDTTETEQGHTDDTTETEQGHTDDTTETEQGYIDDTTDTEQGHTDDTTATEQGHTDDTTETEQGHIDDTKETEQGHTDDTTEMEQGHTDDTTATDHGHTDDTTETEQGHTDDTTATEQGHIDDTTESDHGHTDDTAETEQDLDQTPGGASDANHAPGTNLGHTNDSTGTGLGHIDDTTETDHGHTDDTTATEQGQTDDTTATEQGHIDDTTESDHGHTDDTAETEQDLDQTPGGASDANHTRGTNLGHTNDSTGTGLGHIDDTTETDHGHTDDTTATEQGHTDDTTATEQGHIDDTTESEHGHTDDTAETEQDLDQTPGGASDPNHTPGTNLGHTNDSTGTGLGHIDDNTVTDLCHTPKSILLENEVSMCVPNSRTTTLTMTTHFSFEVDDFVAVILAQNRQRHMYIAKVLQLDGDVQLRFLQATRTAGVYTWPRRDDISWQPQQDVLQKLKPPQLVPGRALKLKFDFNEIKHCKKTK